MSRSTATRNADAAQRIKALTDKLEAGVKDVFESGNYMEYLKTMSKFHRYSFRNVILIYMQFPEASAVAGFQSWKKNFERTVKKGEHGIQIFAPFMVNELVLRDKMDKQTMKPIIGPDGMPEKEWAFEKRKTYRPVYVFDISQTEGKELPTYTVGELTGDVPFYDRLFSAIEQLSPVEIVFRPPVKAKGSFSSLEQKTYINEGMSQIQTIKTAIHETAHAKLHDYGLRGLLEGKEAVKDRQTREVEAESVAYVVCQHFGIDTSDYSFAYVTSWSRDKELSVLKESLDCISITAAEFIDSIEALCPELSHDLKPTVEASENVFHHETHFAAR